MFERLGAARCAHLTDFLVLFFEGLHLRNTAFGDISKLEASSIHSHRRPAISVGYIALNANMNKVTVALRPSCRYGELGDIPNKSFVRYPTVQLRCVVDVGVGSWCFAQQIQCKIRICSTSRFWIVSGRMW
jgi:hypothetical protein